jgi:hypothetical protein
MESSVIVLGIPFNTGAPEVRQELAPGARYVVYMLRSKMYFVLLLEDMDGVQAVFKMVGCVMQGRIRWYDEGEWTYILYDYESHWDQLKLPTAKTRERFMLFPYHEGGA